MKTQPITKYVLALLFPLPIFLFCSVVCATVEHLPSSAFEPCLEDCADQISQIDRADNFIVPPPAVLGISSTVFRIAVESPYQAVKLRALQYMYKPLFMQTPSPFCRAEAIDFIGNIAKTGDLVVKVAAVKLLTSYITNSRWSGPMATFPGMIPMAKDTLAQIEEQIEQPIEESSGASVGAG